MHLGSFILPETSGLQDIPVNAIMVNDHWITLGYAEWSNVQTIFVPLYFLKLKSTTGHELCYIPTHPLIFETLMKMY